jgi:hypothetical protein
MIIPSPYICDECGTQKKESNHWWLLIPDWGDRNSFVLMPWSSLYVDGLDVKHLCSESCATKQLSKWMQSLQSANPDVE